MESSKSSHGFRELIAWQKADQLASLVYRAVKELPPRHRWLVDQVLRSAISVPANIAEGHGRGSLAELTRFIDIARGSLAELEYYIHFMAKESLLTPDKLSSLELAQSEASRVLFGLWRSLKSTNKGNWDHTGRMIREESGVYRVGQSNPSY
jgi:four helix bundle protein